MWNKMTNLDDFAPFGTTKCQNKCDREPIMTPKGPVVICHACKRIVLDNRKGKIRNE